MAIIPYYYRHYNFTSSYFKLSSPFFDSIQFNNPDVRLSGIVVQGSHFKVTRV